MTREAEHFTSFISFHLYGIFPIEFGVLVSQEKGFIKASLAAACFVAVQAVAAHFAPVAMLTPGEQ